MFRQRRCPARHATLRASPLVTTDPFAGARQTDTAGQESAFFGKEIEIIDLVMEVFYQFAAMFLCPMQKI